MICKAAFVLLVAILGTSWLLDGAPNGLASACWSHAKPRPKEQLQGKTELSIDDVPVEPSDGGDLIIGIWVGKKYYTLPSEPEYTLQIRKGKGVTTSVISNPYYRRKNEY